MNKIIALILVTFALAACDPTRTSRSARSTWMMPSSTTSTTVAPISVNLGYEDFCEGTGGYDADVGVLYAHNLGAQPVTLTITQVPAFNQTLQPSKTGSWLISRSMTSTITVKVNDVVRSTYTFDEIC